MSLPTELEDIFLTALEKGTAAERTAWLDEACRGQPELRQAVERLLAAHPQVGDFLQSPPTAVANIADMAREAATEPPGLSFLTPSQRAGSLGRLGHYEILELVGSGGFGIVLKAQDEKLQRVVAIKTLAESLAASATARKRFVREAQAAAAVRHDNVVGIYAVEEDGPVPYLVMEFVEGISLEGKLQQEGTLELKEVLRIGMQVAAGLAAAHKQGLVHRDVKPANILLENGVQRVKITDFGLARAVDDASLTGTGLIAGTPSYMSPEQARGDVIDHRSDLFSLGSVLYFMCTGCSPFRASTTMAVLRRVIDEPHKPAGQLNPDIPNWLATIIDRLIAKQPADRFQSASEVAQLLEQHLADVQQPSSVRQASHLPTIPRAGWMPDPQMRRWTLVAAAALLPLIAIALSEATGVTHLAGTVIRIATGEGTLLVEADDPAVKVTIEGDGGLIITGAGPQEVRLRPGNYRLRAAKDEKPVLLDKELVAIERGGKQVVRVRMEGRRASAEPDDRAWVQLFNAKDLGGWKVHAKQPGNWRVEDGQLVGDAPTDSHLFTVRGDYHDFHLRAEIKINQTGKGGVFFRSEYGFGNAGKFPVGLQASIYNGPQQNGSPERETETTGSLYWRSGYSGILVPNEDWFTLEILAHGRNVTIKVNGVTTTAVSLNPDDEPDGHIALMQRKGTVLRFRKIEIQDLTIREKPATAKTILGGEDRTAPKSPPQVSSLPTDNGLKNLVSASPTDTAQNSPIPEISELRKFVGHEAVVWSVAFSPDGSRALSGSGGQYRNSQISLGSDFTVRLWDVATAQQLQCFTGHQHQVQSVAFTPDGRQAVGAGKIWAWRRWDIESGQELSGFRGNPATPFFHLALSGDATRLLSFGGKDKVLRLWDVATQSELWKFEGLAEEVSAAAFSPDGRHVAAAGGGRFDSIAFQVKPGSDNSIRLWEARSGKEDIRLRGHTSFVRALAFLPDGRRLLSGGADRVLRLWDLQTREELRVYQGHSRGINAVAISSNGRWALSGSADATVRLWDIESGKELCRYLGHTGEVRSVAISPNQRYALSGGYDEIVRLWQLPEPEK